MFGLFCRDIAPFCSAPPLAHYLESKLSDNFAALRRTPRRFARAKPEVRIPQREPRKNPVLRPAIPLLWVVNMSHCSS
jgi:hypothetical protein